MMDDQKVIEVLNKLIQTCKNGEKGLLEAAEDLENPFYELQMQERSRQRQQMAKELQAEVRKLGGNPDKKGTLSGSLHRGWINWKSSGKSRDEAILHECARG